MRTISLICMVLALRAVDIEGLPTGLSIDHKDLLGGEEYEAFDRGFITRKIQEFGYCDAQVEYKDGKMIASPGQRYDITRIVISDEVMSCLFDCEMPMTRKNVEMFTGIFSDFPMQSKTDFEKRSVQLIFVLPPRNADAAP